MAAETLAVFVRAVLVDQFFELTSRQGFHYFGKSGISIHVAGLVLFESSTRSLSPKPWPATLSATPPNLFRTAVRAGGDPEADGPALRTSSPRRRGSITLFRTTEERTGNHPPFPYTERQTTRTAITCSTVLIDRKSVV